MDGMSYNKLVEKLLDFRSMLAVASSSGKRSSETAVDASEPTTNGNVGENTSSQETELGQFGTTDVADTIGREDEVAVEPNRAIGGEGEAVFGGVCRSSREHAPMPFEDSDGCREEQGTTPLVLNSGNQERPPSCSRRADTSIEAAAASMRDAESAKVATVLKEGQLAEEFFRETASQLTYYGLSRLHQEVCDIICRYNVYLG